MIGNHNRLLGSHEGTIGLKNGYTDAAAARWSPPPSATAAGSSWSCCAPRGRRPTSAPRCSTGPSRCPPPSNP